ncbi:MAG: hypothetical protein PHQ27_00660 [Victivallales bacterium]|nr:hypothetical protein [Victivallales bacterium]
MNRPYKIFYFNIVEIALALAVIGIGIAGIMTLFPVALNASRDSVGDNNAPLVAEEMLTYIEARANAETDVGWTGSGIIGQLPITKPNNSPTAVNEVPFDAAHNINGTNIYMVNNSLYGILLTSTNAGGQEVTDFSAIIRVWKQQIPAGSLYIEGNMVPSAALGYQYGADVFVEVSWPSEKPYGQREKRVYMLELFNPNLS